MNTSDTGASDLKWWRMRLWVAYGNTLRSHATMGDEAAGRVGKTAWRALGARRWALYPLGVA